MNLVRSEAEPTLLRRTALFGLFCLSAVLVSLEPIRTLLVLALTRDNNHLSHIVFIPIISATLIYWNRHKIFRNVRSDFLPATVAFAVAGALYYASRVYALGLDENDRLGLAMSVVVALLLGGFLLFYGSSAFKAGLFPLLFLALTIPIPTRLMNEFVSLLQHGSASMVSVLFAITGTPSYREGMIFALPSLTIEVAEACSGIRSTLVMGIVTMLAAHMFLRSNWSRTALLLAVVPVSLFKNAVRIVTLTLLAMHYDMRFLTGDLHRDGGVLFMAAGLCLMYPLFSVLVRSEEKRFFNSGVPS